MKSLGNKNLEISIFSRKIIIKIIIFFRLPIPASTHQGSFMASCYMNETLPVMLTSGIQNWYSIMYLKHWIKSFKK